MKPHMLEVLSQCYWVEGSHLTAEMTANAQNSRVGGTKAGILGQRSRSRIGPCLSE